jgi:hypothetical protein
VGASGAPLDWNDSTRCGHSAASLKIEGTQHAQLHHKHNHNAGPFARAGSDDGSACRGYAVRSVCRSVIRVPVAGSIRSQVAGQEGRSVVWVNNLAREALGHWYG